MKSKRNAEVRKEGGGEGKEKRGNVVINKANAGLLFKSLLILGN